MNFLIFFAYLSVLIATFLTGHALYNLFFGLKPSAKHATSNAKHGLVTVMIPARNEEKVIDRCIRSLLAQDYPQLEIIVYNDQSTDRTGYIVDQLAKEDARLCVLHGTHLPSGWVGKNHGCYQMSQKAKGHWYLFGDSDTNYEPDAISRALATADEHKLEFLSFFPRFDNFNLAEKIFLPVFYFFLFAFFPISQITRHPSPQIVAANGSFILIKQSLYQKIGGHEAVKDKVLEDVLMGRHIKSLGHKVGYGDGSSLYSAHMYEDMKGIWEGFSKNAFSLFGWNYAYAISFVLFTFIFCFSPFLLFVWSLLTSNFLLLLASTIGSALYVFTMLVLATYLRQSLWSVLFFPLTLFSGIAVICNSIIRVATGKGVTWKGRSYAK